MPRTSKNGKQHSRTSSNRNGKQRRRRQLKERPIRPGHRHLRTKRRLVIIGGRVDEAGGKLMRGDLGRLGGRGKLVVARVASEQPGSAWEQAGEAMRGIGVRHLYPLKTESRRDDESPRAMGVLEGATAVLFTGGDQL